MTLVEEDSQITEEVMQHGSQENLFVQQLTLLEEATFNPICVSNHKLELGYEIATSVMLVPYSSSEMLISAIVFHERITN